MSKQHERPYTDTLLGMVSGFARTQELYVCCKLGIPDLLRDKALTARDIAVATNCHEKSTWRLLRKLAVHEILVEGHDGRFSLSQLGELLRTDHPESLHRVVLYVGEINYPTDKELLHFVQTGNTAFERAFGKPFFEYLSGNPQHSDLFNDIMAAVSEPRIVGLVAAYDFSRAKTVVDVGCGKGKLLAGILSANRSVRGIGFDLPSVVAEASIQLTIRGVAERCQVVPGNFFKDAIPEGSDLYLLSSIIHDWDDESAVTVLRNCCAAMARGSKLLLIEELMPERAVDSPATIGNDWNMAKLTGGRERSEPEYRCLLEDAGLTLQKVIPYEPARINLGRKQSCTVMECSRAYAS
jgi:hypothetical protein